IILSPFRAIGGWTEPGSGRHQGRKHGTIDRIFGARPWPAKSRLGGCADDAEAPLVRIVRLRLFARKFSARGGIADLRFAGSVAEYGGRYSTAQLSRSQRSPYCGYTVAEPGVCCLFDPVGAARLVFSPAIEPPAQVDLA